MPAPSVSNAAAVASGAGDDKTSIENVGFRRRAFQLTGWQIPGMSLHDRSTRGEKNMRRNKNESTDEAAASRHEQPIYLTTQDAAEFLRCSKSYLDKLRVTGGGPSYLKLSGGKVLYTRPDLIDWVERGRRRSTNEDPASRLNCRGNDHAPRRPRRPTMK